MQRVVGGLAGTGASDTLHVQVISMQGFADPQLERLMQVLQNGRIWACNIGENFLVTNDGWKRFLKDIPGTALAFTYVSEAHLKRTDLKVQMRAAIRSNRVLSPRRDPVVCQHISNMWSVSDSQ